jgi:hypothetical protein
MKIYKYPIEITDVQKVKLPLNAEILTAQIQSGSGLCLWAKVEEEHNTDTEEHTIEVFGTGHPMSAHDRRYLGTVQQAGGSLIWHIFERCQ